MIRQTFIRTGEADVAILDQGMMSLRVQERFQGAATQTPVGEHLASTPRKPIVAGVLVPQVSGAVQAAAGHSKPEGVVCVHGVHERSATVNIGHLVNQA